MTHSWSPQHFKAEANRLGRSSELVEAALSAAAAIKAVHPNLPVVLTLHHLAHLCSVPARFLQRIIARRQEDPYRVFRVKKRGVPEHRQAPVRRYRTICVPTPSLMLTQRWIAQNILNSVEPHKASFAFAPGRDLVKAANWHLNARWLLKMDVRHFFESINERQVYAVFRSLGYSALLSFQFARICTRLPEYYLGKDEIGDRDQPGEVDLSVGPALSDQLFSSDDFAVDEEDEQSDDSDGDQPDGFDESSGPVLPYRKMRMGHLPQGAPTSPMLANLVVRSLDERLSVLAVGSGWQYTRYADDLAFSKKLGGSRSEAVELARRVEGELTRAGLKNHRGKMQIAPPGARKVILGVQVDGDRLHLNRDFRNNVETHLYALTNPAIGPAAHKKKRGFASLVGMKRHIEGLISFAHQVDRHYAAKLYAQFNSIDWD